MFNYLNEKDYISFLDEKVEKKKKEKKLSGGFICYDNAIDCFQSIKDLGVGLCFDDNYSLFNPLRTITTYMPGLFNEYPFYHPNYPFEKCSTDTFGDEYASFLGDENNRPLKINIIIDRKEKNSDEGKKDEGEKGNNTLASTISLDTLPVGDADDDDATRAKKRELLNLKQRSRGLIRPSKRRVKKFFSKENTPNKKSFKEIIDYRNKWSKGDFITTKDNLEIEDSFSPTEKEEENINMDVQIPNVEPNTEPIDVQQPVDSTIIIRDTFEWFNNSKDDNEIVLELFPYEILMTDNEFQPNFIIDEDYFEFCPLLLPNQQIITEKVFLFDASTMTDAKKWFANVHRKVRMLTEGKTFSNLNINTLPPIQNFSKISMGNDSNNLFKCLSYAIYGDTDMFFIIRIMIAEMIIRNYLILTKIFHFSRKTNNRYAVLSPLKYLVNFKLSPKLFLYNEQKTLNVSYEQLWSGSDYELAMASYLFKKLFIVHYINNVGENVFYEIPYEWACEFGGNFTYNNIVFLTRDENNIYSILVPKNEIIEKYEKTHRFVYVDEPNKVSDEFDSLKDNFSNKIHEFQEKQKVTENELLTNLKEPSNSDNMDINYNIADDVNRITDKIFNYKNPSAKKRMYQQSSQ